MRAIVDPAIGDLVIRSLTALGMSTWIVWMVEPSNDYTLLRSYLVSE
jgi:phosphoribosylformylglycinamidine cyclo-ligase